MPLQKRDGQNILQENIWELSFNLSVENAQTHANDSLMITQTFLSSTREKVFKLSIKNELHKIKTDMIINFITITQRTIID